MNNPFTAFDGVNPNGVVKSPKGTRFSRNGNRFFLSYQGNITELNTPAKAFLGQYYKEAWFPALKSETITFATPAETWIKTTAGNSDTGWAKSRGGNSFVTVLSETTPVLGDILAISAGSYFTYFLKTNGDLYSAGENYDGQLGLGFTSQRETASLVLSDVKKAVSGMYSYYGFAIKNDNTLWGTGNGGSGQWGNGASDSYDAWTEITFVGDITGSGHVVDVACGRDFAAFLMSDNTLWGAGDDIGLGSTPAQIDTNVTAIAAGGYHLLYIKDDGTLRAVGQNSDGQLGTGDTTSHNYDDSVQIDTGVKAIGCGGYHSGYIKNDDTLWMNGANWDGQLGLGDDNQRNTPEQVATNVRSLRGGADHTIFVKNDDTLWGMGFNGDGQLGIETYGNNDVLQPIQIDTNVSSLTTGEEHTMYVKTDKTLYGMGYNYYYNLGDPVYEAGMYSTNATSGWTAISRNYINTVVEGDRNWKDAIYANGKFVAGGGEGSTIVKYSTDGLVWQTASIQNVNAGVTGLAYGSGSFVAVTNVSDFTNAGVPEVYTSTDGITWITGSLNNTNYDELNGITYGGGLFVAVGYNRIVSSEDGINWNECTRSFDGYTNRVAYGNGKYVSSTRYGGTYNYSGVSEYTQTFDNQTADFVSAASRTVFLIKDGTLYGCGESSFGKLGIADIGNVVYFIPITTNVRSVAPANTTTTFVKNDDTLWGMGDNSAGELGDGTTIEKYTPIQIDTNVSKSFGGPANGGYTLYIKNDNTLWGIGGNNNSEIADSAIYGNSITSSIQIDTDVIHAATGNGHILYVKNDNTLWGRGYNNSGQLGLGDNNNRTSSVQIASNVVYCAAGDGTSFYLDTGSMLYGMGFNYYGQLGLGTSTNVNTPTLITGSVSKIAAGYYSSHFIASGSEGVIYNAGYNNAGFDNNGWFGRGNNSTEYVHVPSFISGAIDISCGERTAYIIRNDGTVWACGGDSYGLLGTHYLVEKGTYSTDGLSWSGSLMPDYYYNDVAFGNGRFVMVADEPLAISSTDGINWTSSYISTSSYVVPSRIIFDGTKFVSAGWYGNAGNDIYTSTDGVSWTLSKTGQNGDWGALAYGDGKYVALAGDAFADVNPPSLITI